MGKKIADLGNRIDRRDEDGLWVMSIDTTEKTRAGEEGDGTSSSARDEQSSSTFIRACRSTHSSLVRLPHTHHRLRVNWPLKTQPGMAFPISERLQHLPFLF